MSVTFETEQARSKLVATALAMLSGSISFIEGARKINSLSLDAKLSRSDPDIVPFVAIDSETDALPVGQVRSLWTPDALTTLQPDIDAAQLWAIEIGTEHCQKLIDRFGKGKLGSN